MVASDWAPCEKIPRGFRGTWSRMRQNLVEHHFPPHSTIDELRSMFLGVIVVNVETLCFESCAVDQSWLRNPGGTSLTLSNKWQAYKHYNKL